VGRGGAEKVCASEDELGGAETTRAMIDLVIERE
jgi:hypothetical protein